MTMRFRRVSFLLMVMVAPLPALGQNGPQEVWNKIFEIRRDPSPQSRHTRLEALYHGVDPLSQRYILVEVCRAAVQADEFERARECSAQLIKSASDPEDWNSGNAIHWGNIFLGEAALAGKDIAGAGRFLLAAASAPGSPQLNSYGPDTELARKLLELKQFTVVRSYAERSIAFFGERREIPRAWDALVTHAEKELGDAVDVLRYSQDDAAKFADRILPSYWKRVVEKWGPQAAAANEHIRATPPIVPKDLLPVVERGRISGLALRCDIEWQPNFADMMARERGRPDRTEKQMTFIAMLHGYSQQLTADSSRLLTCSASVHKKISAMIAQALSEIGKVPQ